jgi:hypothetical protein
MRLNVGEAPEETRVIGATKGYLVLILGTTYALTKLLSTITKYVTNTVKDLVSVLDSIEDLRQKKLLNAIMEKELNKKKVDIKKQRMSELKSELKNFAQRKVSGEEENALDQSIERLFEFGEAGGDVDFVTPILDNDTDGQDEDEAATNDTMNEIRLVRNLIRDYQEVRESLRLLENKAEK